MGIPQDWTQHHIIFSRDALLKNPSLISSEPRIAHQVIQRWAAARPELSGEAASAEMTLAEPQRDWNVSLGNGRVAANVFPAKYSFDPSAPPSCANDFVVFGLSRVGNNNQANLVALNNLYSGTTPPGLCGAAPTFKFAYNISTVTAGRILTSPTLSVDGKKIAFVESGNIAGNTMSIFHVLTWGTTGNNGTSATVPAVPGTGNNASMASVTFAADLDTRSSPWVDYNTDTAYVGADDGRIYKITGVFKGTPALAGGFWPVAISPPNGRASSPVLDKNLGLLMVGSQNGTLYSINTATGLVKSVVIGRSGGTNPGILAAPVVDVTHGFSFAVSANDGTSGVLAQVDNLSMTVVRKGQLGQASHGGTAISLFQPAFTNGYFNNPSTGLVRACGTGANNNTPFQYAFGFDAAGIMIAAPVVSSQIVNSVNARCTGWTEFFNPNVGAGGTDFFFFGLTADCTGNGTSGCAVARNANGSLTTFNVTGGPSGIVVDNFSTQPQASSIYFGGVQAPNLAFKLTQNGLQ